MIKKILKDNYVYILIELFLIIVFRIIKNSFLYENILKFDHKIISFRDIIIDEKFTLIFKHITFFGEIYIPILILVCILFMIKNKYYFIINLYNYVSVLLLTALSKIIVNRTRPDFNLIPWPDKYSFPSGHTLTSIVFYIVFCYIATIDRKSRYYLLSIIIILILLISMSRIYLGVHYFSDVVGAFILAIPLVIMNIRIINKYVKEKL